MFEYFNISRQKQGLAVLPGSLGRNVARSAAMHEVKLPKPEVTVDVVRTGNLRRFLSTLKKRSKYCSDNLRRFLSTLAKRSEYCSDNLKPLILLPNQSY